VEIGFLHEKQAFIMAGIGEQKYPQQEFGEK